MFLQDENPWTVTSVNQQQHTAVKQSVLLFLNDSPPLRLYSYLYTILWVCTITRAHSASLRKWVTSCADGLFTRRHICSRPHLGFARYCQIVATAHYQPQKVQNFQQWSKLSNPNWVVMMLLTAQWCSEVPGNTRGRRPLTFLSCFSPLLHR